MTHTGGADKRDPRSLYSICLDKDLGWFFRAVCHLGLERELASSNLLNRRINLTINIEEGKTYKKLSQGANKRGQETR